MEEEEITAEKPETSYDEIPYESNPFPQSHPDRLATIGRIFGMRPAPVTRCRVLEMGCSSGGNIIPAAAVLPESEFVGVDLSHRQVEMGRSMIKGLGINNIRIEHADIRDIDASWGSFDYIISHGVFSWIPEEIREKMLEVAQANLAPQGIAYISYNTYPGWHMRESIRHMMLFQSRQFSDNTRKVQQARALIEFLARNVPTENNAFGLLLKSELEIIKKSKDYYLFHDHLEEVNAPLYFHQFAERAAAHGLQYLGEAELGTMLTSGFSKEVAETLTRISPNIINTEQYMDFLRNRFFRQTLLCHKDVTLKRNVGPSDIEDFLVSSRATTDEKQPIDFSPQKKVSFKTPDGATVETSRPITKAALIVLKEKWPRAVTLTELISESIRRLDDARADHPETKTILATDLLHCYSARVVSFHTWQADFVTEVSEKPTAAPLAAYMCRQNRMTVTNQRHENIGLDAVAQHILPLLDGTKDRSAILDHVSELVKAGKLTARRGGEVITDPDQLKKFLQDAVEQTLKRLAQNALLVSDR